MDVVLDLQAILTAFDRAGIAQYHQLLRDVRLAFAERVFDVADANLALTQHAEDLQPGGTGHRFQQLSQFFHRLTRYIQLSEYILHF